LPHRVMCPTDSVRMFHVRRPGYDVPCRRPHRRPLRRSDGEGDQATADEDARRRRGTRSDRPRSPAAPARIAASTPGSVDVNRLRRNLTQIHREQLAIRDRPARRTTRISSTAAAPARRHRTGSHEDVLADDMFGTTMLTCVWTFRRLSSVFYLSHSTSYRRCWTHPALGRTKPSGVSARTHERVSRPVADRVNRNVAKAARLETRDDRGGPRRRPGGIPS